MRADGTDTDIDVYNAKLWIRTDADGVGNDIYLLPGAAGKIGIGTTTPQRKLHLVDSDAVFRMDRSMDTASFMLVRTTAAGAVLKNFVVGTNASASNVGEFIINDLGTATTGGGTRRMTINNSGSVTFNGSVTAPAYYYTSSLRFKENVAPISDALAVTRQLQGVRFTWKDSGRPSLGLIAEEVAQVLPEVVERNAENGQMEGVNYSVLVAVLIEAVKQQQQQLDGYRAKVASLEAQMSKFETVKARLDKIEDLVTLIGKPMLTQR